MNKTKGFTLIELLIVVAIVGILAAVVFGNSGATYNTQDGSICQAGYKWIQDVNGNRVQVIGDNGFPVKCQ